MVPVVVPGRPHPDPPLGWPDLPPGASVCRRASLAAAGGPGSQLWRAAVREPGGGSRGWPDPRLGRAASAWLRARAQGLPVGLQEEDGRIQDTCSPPNPSSRDRICCLHGRIRFFLTGLAVLRVDQPPPSPVRRDAWLRRRRPTFSSGAIRRPDRQPGLSTAFTAVSLAHGGRNAATAASVGVPGESIVWYILCQPRHHWCRVPRFGGVAEALLLVARDLARPHAASIPDAGGSTSRCLRISCRRGCLRRRTKRRR
jgi:hypothetical protein